LAGTAQLGSASKAPFDVRSTREYVWATELAGASTGKSVRGAPTDCREAVRRGGRTCVCHLLVDARSRRRYGSLPRGGRSHSRAWWRRGPLGAPRCCCKRDTAGSRAVRPRRGYRREGGRGNGAARATPEGHSWRLSTKARAPGGADRSALFIFLAWSTESRPSARSRAIVWHSSPLFFDGPGDKIRLRATPGLGRRGGHEADHCSRILRPDGGSVRTSRALPIARRARRGEPASRSSIHAPSARGVPWRRSGAQKRRFAASGQPLRIDRRFPETT